MLTADTIMIACIHILPYMIIRNNKAEGQCCTNPTYGETSQSQSTTLITGTAAYEALDLSSQQSVATRNGQTYNILNRGQVKGNQNNHHTHFT